MNDDTYREYRIKSKKINLPDIEYIFMDLSSTSLYFNKYCNKKSFKIVSLKFYES